MDGNREGGRDRRDYMRAYRDGYRTRMRRVGLTLSAEEHAEALKAAAEEGEPLASFLKDAAMSHLARRPRPPKELVDRFDELLRQVRGIATNVNQMARHSNRLKAGVEDAEVMLKLRFLEQALRDFLLSGSHGGGRQ